METVTITGQHWGRVFAAYKAQYNIPNFRHWLQAQGVIDYGWIRTNTDPDTPGWAQDAEYTLTFDSGCSAVHFMLKY